MDARLPSAATSVTKDITAQNLPASGNVDQHQSVPPVVGGSGTPQMPRTPAFSFPHGKIRHAVSVKVKVHVHAARKAGGIARAAHAKLVIPFHFLPRYAGREEELRREIEAARAGLA